MTHYMGQGWTIILGQHHQASLPLVLSLATKLCKLVHGVSDKLIHSIFLSVTRMEMFLVFSDQMVICLAILRTSMDGKQSWVTQVVRISVKSTSRLESGALANLIHNIFLSVTGQGTQLRSIDRMERCILVHGLTLILGKYLMDQCSKVFKIMLVGLMQNFG